MINRRLIFWLTLTAILTFIFPAAASAAEVPVVNGGDTAFILICAALVLLMTPGVALFYGGMVRKKNVLNIMMQSFTVMALVSVQWVLFGYSLAFGPDVGHLIGSLDWAGLANVGMDPSSVYATTIPHQLFAAFQLMFAIVTVALITGSFAERMRFSAFVVFALLWTTLVYDPIAHWVWAAGGWISSLGALDFAGGTVVHISSGVSGLVAAMVIGKRLGTGSDPMLPHNLPMTITGAALLWFGWFGFNAGSALSANGLAATAFLLTNTCAAAGALSWMAAEWLDHGQATALGAVSGAVAGLVAITPAAGFVTPLSSIILGLVTGPVCYLMVSKIKGYLGYDDSLDAFGIHGIGGMIGAIGTGVFATSMVNPAADGLLAGNPALLGAQLIAIAATIAYAAVMTLIILKVINKFLPVRVNKEEEETGLDMAMHGEDAYKYDMGAAAGA